MRSHMCCGPCVVPLTLLKQGLTFSSRPVCMLPDEYASLSSPQGLADCVAVLSYRSHVTFLEIYLLYLPSHSALFSSGHHVTFCPGHLHACSLCMASLGHPSRCLLSLLFPQSLGWLWQNICWMAEWVFSLGKRTSFQKCQCVSQGGKGPVFCTASVDANMGGGADYSPTGRVDKHRNSNSVSCFGRWALYF